MANLTVAPREALELVGIVRAVADCLREEIHGLQLRELENALEAALLAADRESEKLKSR
jgi:hypothetical protein